MDIRAALLRSRPEAVAYARSLAELPASIVGLSARLTDLAIFPVKGLGALHLERARVDARGLVDPRTGLVDRGVMLAYRKAGATSEGDRFDAVGIANVNEPALARTTASISRGALVYEAPTLASLRLDPASLAPTDGRPIRVKLRDDMGVVVEGVVDEGPLAPWVADLLRANPARRRFAPEDVVAVRAATTPARPVAAPHAAGEEARTVFSDGAHVSVASAATLAWMNDALSASGNRTISMAVFRPNLVLDGLPPNAEDVAREVHVFGRDAHIRLVFASMCVRCDALCVDPATGRRPDAQPLAWLARNRPAREGNRGATFAMNAVFPRDAWGAVLSVGDAVRIGSER